MIQHKAIPALLHLTAQTGIQPVGSAQGGTQAPAASGERPATGTPSGGQQHEPQTGGSGGRKRRQAARTAAQTGRRSFRGLLRHAQQQVGQIHAGRHAHALRRQAPGQQIRDAPRAVGAGNSTATCCPAVTIWAMPTAKKSRVRASSASLKASRLGHARTAGGAHRDHARHLVTRDTEQRLAGAQIVGRGERQFRQLGKIMQRTKTCRGPAPDPGQTLPVQRTVQRHMAKIGIEQLQLGVPARRRPVLGGASRRTPPPARHPAPARKARDVPGPAGRPGQERRRLAPYSVPLPGNADQMPSWPSSPQARRCG